MPLKRSHFSRTTPGKQIPPLLLTGLLALTLGACGGEGSAAEGQGDGEGTADPSAETGQTVDINDLEAPGPKLGGETFWLKAADDTPVAAEFISVEGAPARGSVILVHMLGSQRGDWAPLVQPLIESGFDVLAIDLRGHGQSTVLGERYREFDTADWLAAAQDIRAAVAYLSPQISPPHFLIGASIGANLSLIEAAEDNRVSGIITLSPGDDYRGVSPADSAAALGKRPVLLVAAEEDAYSAESTRELATQLENARAEIYPGSGHGTNLFTDHPELYGLITTWLADTVGAAL